MVIESEIQEKLKTHREEKSKEVTESKETTVTPEELEQLKKLQLDMDTLIVAFGNHAIQELAITKQKEVIEQELSALKTREVDLAKNLTDKYGRGTLDIETGKFTSTN